MQLVSKYLVKVFNRKSLTSEMSNLHRTQLYFSIPLEYQHSKRPANNQSVEYFKFCYCGG